MGTMCAVAQRHDLFRRIEKYLNADNPKNRPAFIAAMKKGPSSTDALIKLDILNARRDRALIEHIKVHWYGDTWEAWWPDHEDRDVVSSLGFIELLEGKGDTSKIPVSILWVCSGDYFQRILLKTEVQLTLIILTPPIPAGQRLAVTVKVDNALTIVANDEEARYCLNNAERQIRRHDRGIAPPNSRPKLSRRRGFRGATVIKVRSE